MSSSDKIKLQNLFCTTFKDFLQDLYNSYPDADLSLLITFTNGLCLTFPDKLVEEFMNCIIPYKEKILNKDENFFLDGGLKAEVQNNEYIVKQINKVVAIWRNPKTSKNTKDCIWTYLQYLIKIGTKCV